MQNEIISRLKPGMIELIVSFEEYVNILLEVKEDLPPKPPVKKKVSEYKRNLFGFKLMSSVEYDYQSPKYLQELEEYKISQRQPKVLQIYGPYGLVKIKHDLSEQINE